jgi:intracellular septation protein A
MKIAGIILTVLGGLLILGSLVNIVTVYNSSDGHDVSKFFGGAGLAVVILVVGLILIQKSKKPSSDE